tara:strand:- start:249 stop:3485 length:3237 start_codon:yes stop_codon:yes gene_type:complete
MPRFSDLVKAWKPYHGKGKRTGTPGHYEYQYEQLGLFDQPKPKPKPKPKKPAPQPARPREQLGLFSHHEETAPTQKPASMPEPDEAQSAAEAIAERMYREGRVEHVAKDKHGRSVTRWVNEETARTMRREEIDVWEEAEPSFRGEAEEGGVPVNDPRSRPGGGDFRLQERLRREAEERAERELSERRNAWRYPWEAHPSAILPKDVARKSEYRLWEKAGDEWRIYREEGDTEGAPIPGDVLQRDWEEVLSAAGGAGAQVSIMPADAKPDADRVGRLIEMSEFETSPDRPPNFLGLDPDKLPTRKVRNRGFWDHRPDPRDPFLDHLGFYDAVLGSSGGRKGWEGRFGIYFGALKDGRGWDQLRGRQREFYASIHRDLAAWWSDLEPEHRDKVWSYYCDDTRQTTISRVTVPEHEDVELSLPEGMEKLDDLGWKIDAYQAKAINFASDHAPRAVWAMEMGLGKTLCAFATYHKLRERGDVKQMLVVAPVSAHGSWEEHAEKISNARTVSLRGANVKKRRAAYEAFSRGEIDVLVVSTDTIKQKDLSLEGLEDLTALAEEAGGPEHLRSVRFIDPRNLASASVSVTAAGRIQALSEEEIEWRDGRWQRPPHDPREVPDLQEMKFVVDDPTSDKSILAGITREHGESTLRCADEVHKFKNPKAKRSKGFWEVMTEPEGRVIGMSGTPKPNGIEDFYHVCNHVAPGELGSWEEFAEQYTYRHLKKIPGGSSAWETGGVRPDAMGDLYQNTARFLFSRTLDDPDTPEKAKRVDLAPRIEESDFQVAVRKRFGHWCEIKARIRAGIRGPRGERWPDVAAMEELERAYDGELGEAERLSASGAHTNDRVMLMRCQQLAISPALLDPTEEWSKNNPDYESPKVAAIADAYVAHMSQNPETGGVIFSSYNASWVEEMRRALRRRGVTGEIPHYKGGLSKKQAADIEDGVNSGKYPVILANTKALETGANMQKRASFVAHINTPWEPDKLSQSTGRVWRRGQRNTVTVLRPIGSPIEEIVDRKVSAKIRQGAMLAGATTAADAAIVSTMRKPGQSTKEELAEALGMDVAIFGREKGGNFEVPELLEEDS